ncbi:M15 family metallopeptidase [Streptomyces sp. YC504]|uniref:M15 family metallopeptidase n=1 Tax=Streptomyces mesophilus TaxID=1775132 RepID=A0A6G4XU04_9ACTN|nr:M15 family metallopeptidase [Streptomyces mesophilus]NGO80174.1 M15 family metallopeptidase [Streptomyces mesophilus]
MQIVLRVAAAASVLLLTAGACPASAASSSSASSSAASSAPPPSPGLSPSTSTAALRAAAPKGPVFQHRTLPVTRAALGRTYRPGCPVPPGRLRLLRMSHWGFDGKVHTGEMVVHERVAKDVLYVFWKAFGAKFPIRKMRPLSAYHGSDQASMADDNTSAFNCRQVVGNPGSLSQHSYGDAIDINTVENPYVDRTGRIHPPAGARHLDRWRNAKGMIRSGDVITRAFRAIGWEWGGRWSNPDYQHFSRNGR